MLHDTLTFLLAPLITVFVGVSDFVGAFAGSAQIPFSFFLVMLIVPLWAAVFQREPG